MSSAITVTERKRTLIFVNLLITCIASGFLSTALSTALPPIIVDFDISVSTGQWLTSTYSLAAGIMMPLTAFLIIRFPTKKLYLFALVLFLAGLLVSILAYDFPTMMVGRILQACSNGITGSMAQVVLLSIYPREKQGTIMGWYGLSISAAPVIAPTIAGILVDTAGWRMIFIIPFFILMLSLIWASVVFDNVLDNIVQKFDIISFILTAFAFSGITLGIGNITSQGLTHAATFVPLGIGLLSGVIFVWRQLKMEQPFLDIRLFRFQSFRLSVIGSMMLYLTMMGIALLMPLYVQSVMGYSATVSGLVTLPGSLAMAVISPMAGKFYDKMGMRNLAIVGSAALALSAVGMAFISMQTPLGVAVVLNIIFNVAIGCLMMPFVTWGIGSIDKAHTAHGTALLNSLRTISGAVGTALFVGIMNMVALRSMETYGSNADIHGLNVAFAVISVVAFALLFIAIVCIKKEARQMSNVSR